MAPKHNTTETTNKADLVSSESSWERTANVQLAQHRILFQTSAYVRQQGLATGLRGGRRHCTTSIQQIPRRLRRDEPKRQTQQKEANQLSELWYRAMVTRLTNSSRADVGVDLVAHIAATSEERMTVCNTTRDHSRTQQQTAVTHAKQPSACCITGKTTHTSTRMIAHAGQKRRFDVSTTTHRPL